MFHFGLSYTGLIFLIMLFVPNIIWSKNLPEKYEDYSRNENKVLLMMERIGEVLVACLLLIFSDFNIRSSYWAVFLIAAFVLMVLYEIYWMRYFRSSRTMADMYSGICGIPVAGASLPVIAAFLIGIYGSNIFLIIAAIFLGIGHIGIHLNHRKEAYADAGITLSRPGLPVRIVRGIILGILALGLAVTSIVIGIRNFTYISHVAAAAANNGTVESLYIPIGGQDQYINIRGNNSDNPVIIYLHGGPSSPDAFETFVFTDYLADDFTVISWDQRGCGRTYFNNIDKDSRGESVNFDQAVSDLDELVDYALNRFHKDKVIIMGWSYGTILGSRYITLHPDKVSRYIGIGQFVNMVQNEEMGYQVALERAIAAGDDTSALESAYRDYGIGHTLISMLALRNLTYQYQIQNQTHMANQTIPAVLSPYFGMDDFRWFMLQTGDMNDYMSLNRELFDYLMVDVSEFGLDYEVPVTYITGSEDFTCNGVLVEDMLENVTAPDVHMHYMEGCGHGCHYDNPEEFAELVKNA